MIGATYPECPLLVLTHLWPESPDEDTTPEIVVSDCGHALYLCTEDAEDLRSDGTTERNTDYPPHWEVRCAAGHVVLVPLDDTDGNIPVPPEPALIVAALAHTQGEAP